jgi:threonine dehydrogenase-like Zn-dependent dehydrogenase
VPLPGAVDSDTAASLALLAVAQTAVAAVDGIAPDSVEVTGNGLIALQVRELLGRRGAAAPFDRPTAVVDTTGDPRVIIEATRRIADLGTVALVGESLGRTAEMNLYPDVHVRGLTLMGVPSPLRHPGALFAEADDPLFSSCRQALVEVAAGTTLPPNGAWFRLTG